MAKQFDPEDEEDLDDWDEDFETNEDYPYEDLEDEEWEEDWLNGDDEDEE